MALFFVKGDVTRVKLFRKILIVVALCIIIPWVTTISFTGVVKREINNIGSDIKRVRVDVGRSVMEVSVEDYIAGVLAARLSYGEEIELLKAEAVMIRSGIYAAMGDEICIDDDVISMTYLTDKERKKLWGSDYEEKEALVEECQRVLSDFRRDTIVGFRNTPTDGSKRIAVTADGNRVPDSVLEAG